MNEYKRIDSERIANTYSRYDKLIVSGKGAWCVDEDGKELLDFTSGIGVNCLGFCNDQWSEAVSRQAAKLQHSSNLFYTGPQIELALQLTERAAMAKVFFANSGAEANECAIKAARKYGNSRSQGWRNKIITLKNSFHGRTMASLTATGQEKYHQDFEPFVDGFDYCTAGDFEQMKALTDKDTCAIMLELVQGEGGVIPLEQDFVKNCAKLCKERDLLLIIDEVQTGIGRTGTLFAYEQYGIEPDMVTFAKGIGGGLPLGGVLFNQKTADIFQPGDHGTTFGGNPVVCAGALAVMEQLTPQLLDQVKRNGNYIMEKLKEMPAVEEVCGLGLMIGFRVEGVRCEEVVAKAMAQGLLLLTAKDKVRMLPPLIVTRQQIDRGLELLRKAVL